MKGRMSPAILAAVLAAGMGSLGDGPRSHEGGKRSAEDQAKLDAERLAAAPRAIRRAAEKQKRKAEKRKGEQTV